MKFANFFQLAQRVIFKNTIIIKIIATLPPFLVAKFYLYRLCHIVNINTDQLQNILSLEKKIQRERD